MKAELRDDGYIALSFDYDPDIVSKTKKVFDDRAWEPNKKHWKIHLSELDTLKEEFPHANISKELKEEYKKEYDPEYGEQEIPEVEVPNFNGELRDFQKVGVKKMYDKERLLLGDEMGTGKTVHTIATALKLKYEENKKSFLVICPSSLKQQWKSEIEKFTDEKVTVIDGRKEKRQEQWQEDSYFYVMNYALLLHDEEPFDNWWGGLALDEATYIKNRDAKRTQKAKELKADYKYALSGTPIENSAEDIYSIVEFLDKDILGNYYDFKNRFLKTKRKSYNGRTWTDVVGYKNLDKLYKKLKPIYLRRVKDDVLDDLPSKTEKKRVVKLTSVQRTAYNRYKQDVLDRLEKEEHFMGKVIMARMVANHTQLVNKSEADSSVHDHLEASSSKMDELEEIRREVYSNDDKMLVFTNFRKMADIIHKEEENTYKVTGQTKDKDKELTAFKEDDEPAMLVATDAIEHGVNLQQANVVVHFDLPFNPATLKQRNDRTHRMGQEKPVTVIKLLAENTIEERVEAILDKKEELSDAVVEGEAVSDDKFKLDAQITEKLI